MSEGEEADKKAGGAGQRQKSKRKSGEPHSHLWSRGEQKREGEVRGGRGR